MQFITFFFNLEIRTHMQSKNRIDPLISQIFQLENVTFCRLDRGITISTDSLQ